MIMDESTMKGLSGVLDKILKILSKITPELIKEVTSLISSVAELLGLKDEDDSSEELGLKSEIADKRLEDFDSREEYINYLKDDVELDEYDREKLNNESLKEKYSAKGLDIEMGAINEKIGVKLGLEDYVMMAKAGINKVQDFMTIIDTFKEKGVEPLINEAIERLIPMKEGATVIDTLKEGVNKIENAKATWDKFNDMLENF
ncbi:hypothetical protein [Fusobacterium periodonticum]|uniref:Uncharacterized protein n=2 Tax=Fusobacterium periodonticum TaxID=860 RepID=A0AAD0MQ33_9FUSO|nr:hypothetical protein [Fusobacterium periodonticum]AVQ25968.1 hypothetical protein C4N17_10140 [Fusobacterium periodonticum]KGE61667.1 hypothetical protein FSAG_002249 [Fusobacterium periodonticum 2_1_31]